jgi:hypothetical protein
MTEFLHVGNEESKLENDEKYRHRNAEPKRTVVFDKKEEE